MSRFIRSYRFIRLSKINLLYALLLGALPTIILMLTSPLNLSKYEVNLTQRIVHQSYWYEDLESDLKKEKLCVGYNPDSTVNLYIVNDEDELLGQFNLEYPQAKPYSYKGPVSHDINGDGIKEIILLTQNGDSLFINAFDYRHLEVVLESRFITVIGGFNQKKDYNAHWLGWFDVNDDKVEELYFSISAGFALFPRRIFRYDFINDSLLCSANTGAAFLTGEVFPNNSSFNLMVSSAASSNTAASYPYPYHDTCCWIFNFNKDLELISHPIPLGSYPSNATPIIKIAGRAFCIYSAYNQSKVRSIILEISPEGKIVDSLAIPNISIVPSKGLPCFEDILFTYSRFDVNENIAYGTDPLIKLPVSKVRFLKGSIPQFQEDLDLDGKLETMLYNRETISYIFYPDGQFTKGLVITPLKLENSFITAKYYPWLKKGEIAFSSSTESEIYTYSSNPNYKFRVLIWFMIYCLSVTFVLAVMYLQRKRMESQHKLEQEVADLNLQNLRNQLDPHFTFNALNSVGNAIYQEDKDKAYDLFQRFIRMIRSSLLDSQHVFRSLDEEIQFTIDYLEFQKTRFRDRFDYSIFLDPELNPKINEIPKMLIQGFAENAVKHAFNGIDYKGKISISLLKEDHGYKVLIEDNGIGIAHSKMLGTTSGTQKGEQIIRDQIKQINKLYQRKITIKVTDKADLDGLATGTRVEILLFY